MLFELGTTSDGLFHCGLLVLMTFESRKTHNKAQIELN